ncbi:glucose-6-phosphate isomerase [Bdellovibrio sp. HCB337]|uniref:glucose-6-phosphate isomerase n=1 Tax=Bdellovibrio sp. HCB337 TaxID=3394358 RepID=UPI0039A5C922
MFWLMKIIQASHKTNENILKHCRDSYRKFLQRSEIGFSKLPERKALWLQSREAGDQLGSKFKKMVIVGLGGSSLGTRVIQETFFARNLFFIDNVDAMEFEALVKELGDLKEVCWAFVSKSGTTIESLCALEILEQVYKEKSLKLSDYSLVISETKESSLTKWARANKVLECEIPLDVGGRFSVLSPVGMVPAAFLGVSLEEIRTGAVRAVKDEALVVELMAQFMQSFERGEWISLLWSYNSRMKNFGLWFQQLWAESLGKAVKRDGSPAPRVSTPLCAVGVSDQHSILQQVMEGAKDKFVLFQRFGDSEGGSKKVMQAQFPETKSLEGRTMGALLGVEAQSTQEALNHNGVSTLTLTYEALNAESLGYQFMLWELVVAGLGEALAINAFDQPGVELGKVLAKKKLQN